MIRAMLRTGIRLLAAVPAAGILLVPPVFAAAEDDAKAVIESLHAALVEVAETGSESGLDQRIATLAPVILQTHDIERMGRLTIGRFWRNLSEDQRQSFIQAFERLSVTTYASRFAAIGPETFESVSSKLMDDDSAEVTALIHRAEGEPVEMVYEIQLEGEDWRIVQILADGVSELGLMRSSYYEILDTDGLAGLIETIEAEIAGYYDR
jgi:phospholipid transport system substrate-binding protein